MSVAFSQDGSRLVTASEDHTARVWAVSDGDSIFELLGHTAGLSGASFSPDGSQILTHGRDKVARVWDAETGQEQFALTSLTDWVRAAKFSPDGSQFLTGGLNPFDGIRLWSADNGTELLRVSGSALNNSGVAFSPDGSKLLTLNTPSGDASWYWQQQTGRKLVRLSEIGAQDSNGHVWDIQSGSERLILTDGSEHSKQIALYSPVGSLALTDTGESGTLWNTCDGQPVHYFSNLNDSYATHFTAAAFSPTGALCSLDRTTIASICGTLKPAKNYSDWKAKEIPNILKVADQSPGSRFPLTATDSFPGDQVPPFPFGTCKLVGTRWTCLDLPIRCLLHASRRMVESSQAEPEMALPF